MRFSQPSERISNPSVRGYLFWGYFCWFQHGSATITEYWEFNTDSFKVLLLLQLFVTAREVEPVTRFKSAVSKLQTCFLIIALALVTLHGDYGQSQNYTDRVFVTSVLTGAQVIAALALMATIFCLKRRPAVFRPDHKAVDRQMTDSLWARYTFKWCQDTLKAAGKEKFENSDMPAMDHVVRSENATANFKRIVFKEDNLPLWAHIFWKFRYQFLFQWTGILFSNFFDVAPAFATLQLLRYLENRDDTDAIDPKAWKYVAGIVVATVSSRLVDSRIFWAAMAGMLFSFPRSALQY